MSVPKAKQVGDVVWGELKGGIESTYWRFLAIASIVASNRRQKLFV